VLAALNIAHELLQARREGEREQELARSLGRLNERLDDLLNPPGR
jgi:cell division protein ZapA (FtsZ GTPase activity inhibitor)